HEFLGALGVTSPAVHQLDEPGRVRISDDVGCYVVAVLEPHISAEELRRLHPPLVLLGPVAVAPGCVLRLEACDANEPAIIGDPCRRSKPASRAGRALLIPRIKRRAQLLRVCRLATDYLNEHDEPPPGWAHHEGARAHA